MATPFATLSDYQIRAGRTLSGADADRVTALLADASALIRSRLPAGYTPDADLARAVCAAVTQRAVVNPGGLRTKTVGAASYAYDQDGGLYLTDEETSTLLAAYEQGAGGDAAFSLTAPDEGLRNRWACPPRPPLARRRPARWSVR